MPGRRRRTIVSTCAFSAWPVPTTDFFDRRGAVFDDGEAAAGRRQQHDPAGVAELQRGAGVLVDETFLDGGFRGSVAIEHLVERGVKLGEPVSDGAVLPWMDRPRGDAGEAVAAHLDDSPAGMAQTWIEADEPHPAQAPSRAMTSSGTSKLA